MKIDLKCTIADLLPGETFIFAGHDDNDVYMRVMLNPKHPMDKIKGFGYVLLNEGLVYISKDGDLNVVRVAIKAVQDV